MESNERQDDSSSSLKWTPNRKDAVLAKAGLGSPPYPASGIDFACLPLRSGMNADVNIDLRDGQTAKVDVWPGRQCYHGDDADNQNHEAEKRRIQDSCRDDVVACLQQGSCCTAYLAAPVAVNSLSDTCLEPSDAGGRQLYKAVASYLAPEQSPANVRGKMLFRSPLADLACRSRSLWCSVAWTCVSIRIQ